MPLTDSDIAGVMQAGVTSRMQRLDLTRGYYDGTIYDGRPDFFDDSAPLRERKPCVVYPVVRSAVQSYASLCLGDGKFPIITSGTSEDDSVVDARFGLSDIESVVVDAGIRKIADQVRLSAVAQQVFETELGSGTSCTVSSVVRGKLRVSQLDARVCTPTFAPDDPDTVISLEVKYRYIDESLWNANEGKTVRRVFVYRRVIDATTDTTFTPVEITKASDDPVPNSPAQGGAFVHNFGFCPVVWRRANSAVSDQRGLDGRAIHWGLFSLIDTINLGLSQRFRAALYSGDPQLVEIGVRDDEVRIPTGRTAASSALASDASGNFVGGGERKQSGGSSEKKRKRGAGVVWRYESPDANVKMLVLPGDALAAITDDIADNIKKLREALGHIYIDPDALSGFGDISGKTLAFIFAQQIARCDRLREDFARGWILPVLNMLFRIVLACGPGLYLAGAAKLQPILKRFSAAQVAPAVATTPAAATAATPAVATTQTMWFEPQLTLKWGAYFDASDIDEATRIDAALKAYNGKVITLATVIDHLRGVFTIGDPDQYIDKLRIELAQRQTDALAAQQALVGAMCATDVDGIASASDIGNAANAPVAKTPRLSTRTSAAQPAQSAVAKTVQLVPRG